MATIRCRALRNDQRLPDVEQSRIAQIIRSGEGFARGLVAGKQPFERVARPDDVSHGRSGDRLRVGDQQSLPDRDHAYVGQAVRLGDRFDGRPVAQRDPEQVFVALDDVHGVRAGWRGSAAILREHRLHGSPKQHGDRQQPPGGAGKDSIKMHHGQILL